MDAIVLCSIALFAVLCASADAAAKGWDDYDYWSNSIRCPVVAHCPSHCRLYRASDSCVYCGYCKARPLWGCPPVECFDGPGVACSTTRDWRGCLTCKCEKTKVRCPIPMCSSNCRLRTGIDGCQHCDCKPRTDCPNRECPADCEQPMGADGCPDCVCRDAVAVCPEVNCDFTRCKHKINYRTGCAEGCICSDY